MKQNLTVNSMFECVLYSEEINSNPMGRFLTSICKFVLEFLLCCDNIVAALQTSDGSKIMDYFKWLETYPAHCYSNCGLVGWHTSWESSDSGTPTKLGSWVKSAGTGGGAKSKYLSREQNWEI